MNKLLFLLVGVILVLSRSLKSHNLVEQYQLSHNFYENELSHQAEGDGIQDLINNINATEPAVASIVDDLSQKGYVAFTKAKGSVNKALNNAALRAKLGDDLFGNRKVG